MTATTVSLSLGSPAADTLGGFVIVGLFALALIVWDGVRFLLKRREK